jgi:hypothetical protein
MQAMEEVNGREGFFSNAREFPSYKDPTVPESEVAVRYAKHGSPWVMRYLPFWLAEFIDRMFIMLMPLIAFTYPIIRLERDVILLKVPHSFAENYFQLRSNIVFVRDKLRQRDS